MDKNIYKNTAKTQLKVGRTMQMVLAGTLASLMVVSGLAFYAFNKPTEQAKAAVDPSDMTFSTPVQIGGTTNYQAMWAAEAVTNPADGKSYFYASTASGSPDGTPAIPGGKIVRVDTDTPGTMQTSGFINDSYDATNTGDAVHTTYANNGLSYVAYRRTTNTGFKSMIISLDGSGSPTNGVSLDSVTVTGAGTGQIDHADLAYSNTSSRVYMTGNLFVAGSPGITYWVFGETANGGTTFINTVNLYTNPANGGAFSGSSICVSPNNDVHVVGSIRDGNGTSRFAAISRIGGTWSSITTLTPDSTEPGWSYGGSVNALCAPNGDAYAVWKAAHSFGMARMDSGSSTWQVLHDQYDDGLAPTAANSLILPDGRVVVAMTSTDLGGTQILVSDDEGATLTVVNNGSNVFNNIPIISSDLNWTNLTYSDTTKKLHVVGVYSENSGSATSLARRTYYTYADLTPIVPPNQSPTVTLAAAPTSGTAPLSTTLTATASDPDGAITKVEFFQDGGVTPVATDTTIGDGWTAPITGLAAGTYSFTAKAYDDNDPAATTTSAAATVTVSAPANQTPTVSVAAVPATGTSPLDVVLTATAADPDSNDTLNKVEFYNGDPMVPANKLGEDTTSPYTFDWDAVETGTYTVRAKLIYNTSSELISSPITVTVSAPANQVPTITMALSNPPSGNIYTAPATIVLTGTASDPDGTLTKIELYNGTTKLGEVVPTAEIQGVQSMGLNTVNTMDTGTFTFTLSNVVGGTYSLNAKAYDNDGGIGSTTQNIPLTVNTPPTVSITQPSNNYTAVAPASVVINATASDADGTVAKVEFYNGTSKIGEDTTSPYSYTYSVSAGNYTLTAKAFDNNDAVTTSTPVSIIITAPAPLPRTGGGVYFLAIALVAMAAGIAFIDYRKFKKQGWKIGN